MHKSIYAIYLPEIALAVLPEPFQPTMRVRGAVKMIVSPFSGPKERMPCIIIRSILDMLTPPRYSRYVPLDIFLLRRAPMRLIVRGGERRWVRSSKRHRGSLEVDARLLSRNHVTRLQGSGSTIWRWATSVEMATSRRHRHALVQMHANPSHSSSSSRANVPSLSPPPVPTQHRYDHA